MLDSILYDKTWTRIDLTRIYTMLSLGAMDKGGMQGEMEGRRGLKRFGEKISKIGKSSKETGNFH